MNLSIFKEEQENDCVSIFRNEGEHQRRESFTKLYVNLTAKYLKSVKMAELQAPDKVRGLSVS